MRKTNPKKKATINIVKRGNKEKIIMKTNAKKKAERLKKKDRFTFVEAGQLGLAFWGPGEKATTPTARIVMSWCFMEPVPPKGHTVPALTTGCVTAEEMDSQIFRKIRQLKYLREVTNQLFKEHAKRFPEKKLPRNCINKPGKKGGK